MKENVLDVLIYLFENYMFEADEEEPEQETLIIELTQAGFSPSIVDQAFVWLEKLSDIKNESHYLNSPFELLSVRQYSEDESRYLGEEALAVIGKLERFGVLDVNLREVVITQIVGLGAEAVDDEHVKWVIMMVLANYYDNDAMVDWSEAIVHDELHSCIH